MILVKLAIYKGILDLYDTTIFYDGYYIII